MRLQAGAEAKVYDADSSQLNERGSKPLKRL
jgi:hypothetical protein